MQRLIPTKRGSASPFALALQWDFGCSLPAGCWQPAAGSGCSGAPQAPRGRWRAPAACVPVPASESARVPRSAGIPRPARWREGPKRAKAAEHQRPCPRDRLPKKTVCTNDTMSTFLTELTTRMVWGRECSVGYFWRRALPASLMCAQFDMTMALAPKALTSRQNDRRVMHNVVQFEAAVAAQ